MEKELKKENTDVIAAILTVAWGSAKATSFERRNISQTEILNIYKNFKKELK